MRPLRSLVLCVIPSALLIATAAMSQTSAPVARIVNPIDESQLTTIKGTVHPLANARNDRGAAPDSLQLDRMHLVLTRSASQEAALRQLINQMHTPSAASYHEWLTPDQFGKQFGPSDEDITAVETWLAGHGLSVAKVNPGKQTIEFSGNVAQLRSAFHTQIHKYEVNGETHYANANNPQIPAALAPVVGGFVSLNNFRLKNNNHYLGKATYNPKTDKAQPQWTIGPGGPPQYETENFVLAPQDFYVQYDLNPLYTAGTSGTGQTIAIVNDSNINVDLANQFRSLFGLSVNPPQVIIDGNDPGVDGINNPDGPNYDSGEAYIDVEWSGAVAPNATIDLVIAADTALEDGLLLAAERAVYSNVAPVMSVSFGACERNMGIENEFLYSLWEQAAAQGITVMVSAGDSGSASCDNGSEYAEGGQAVNGFASTPFNVAVGGTDFYYTDYAASAATLDAQLAGYWNTANTSNSTPAVSILGVIPEQPWNDSQFGLNIFSQYATYGTTDIVAGGGGASNCALATYDADGDTTACTGGYPKPSWQTAAIGMTGLNVPSDNVRDLPDVSLFAANGQNDSYYPVCAADGDCQPASSATDGYVQISGYGGTSVASPAFAGIMALVNQKYGVPQGQADFVLYPLAKQFPAAFHDVTAGSNAVPCDLTDGSPDCIVASSANTVLLDGVTEGEIGINSTPEYNAGPLYDLASGLGTVDANVLVNDWNKVTFKTSETSLTAVPANNAPLTSIPHGTAVTISGKVTGSGTPSGNVALMTNSTEQGQQGQGLPALVTNGYLNGGQSTFTLQSDGSYSGTISTLPGGSYDIWTQYSGDGTYGMSSSTPPIPITVVQEASTINFNIFSLGLGEYSTASNPPSQVDYGTQTQLSAMVAPSAGGQSTSQQNCVINGGTCPAFTIPTGTVAFKDGTTTLNTAALNAEGDAEYNAPFSVGTHSVTASYSGDSSYTASTASPIAFSVVKDTPTYMYNFPLVNSSGQLPNGPGEPTVISFQVENTAQYNAANPSNGSVFPVGVLAPTGTLAYSSTPAGISGSVTLSPAVDPVYGAVEGVANITVPAGTAGGSYVISLTYSGDANYVGGTGNLPNAITIAPPTGLTSTIAATVTGSISPTTFITVTGTVTGQSGHAAPTSTPSQGTGVGVYVSGDSNNYNYLGVVDFSSSSGDISSFSFTLNSQTLPQGANLITLQYSGDSNYAPSAITLNSGSPISNPLSDFSLVPATTIVPINVANGASSNTDVINLASVNGFSGSVGLTCKAAAGVSCSIPQTAGLSSGGNTTATLTLSAQEYTPNLSYNVLVTGTDPTGKFIHTLGIEAVVSGSAAGSSSFALTNSGNLTVAPGATTGNTSTITVTPLGAFAGTVALSCSVTSPQGATSAPTCALATLSVAGSGTDMLTVSTTSTTTAGTYTVTVTGISGPINETTTVTVNVGTPSFAFSPAPSPSSITINSPGGTGTSTLTFTSSDGFAGTVSLSCSVVGPTGANDPATCAVPSSVSVTSSTPGTATLTVYTTAATTSLNQTRKLFWPAASGATLALVLFFGIPRRRRNWLAMLGLLVLFVSVAAIGCGGGSSNNGGGGGGGGNSGTTTGSYTVTVTAVSGSITQTATVPVTVN